MKRFKKAYIEISNICNLNCSFCPGTKRTPKKMTTKDFTAVIKKLAPFTDYVYFHLLGEPLLHPNLEEFLKIAENYGLKVIITTNGTLLKEKSEVLLNSNSHYKTVISLHSFEANQNQNFDSYISDCLDYAKMAEGKKIVVLRLWNSGGEDKLNSEILEKIEDRFPSPWRDTRGGKQIGDNLYIQFGDKFDWPDIDSPTESETAFCYGLRDQIGVLCDGTVVPCCLDNNGEINLGNIFESNLGEIINSPRALNIYNGFSNRKACEELCKKCTFARKF
ncbi:MAG: SPASM domain-containing protein [Clostridia bacterium]|nr:SPASM domain-containing protein [Clostridia bacterium]